MTTERFLADYVARAPLPLAFERTLECRILIEQAFTRPILDLGCGDGIFARVLFDEPVDVGLDPDADELAQARKTGAYVTLVEAEGTSIPYPDDHFNTVFANSVLEHIPDLSPVLTEVRRVLSPAGRFYVTLPTEHFQRFSVVNTILEGVGLRAAAAGWQRFFNRFWKHHNVHPPQGWRAMFETHGFRVVEQLTYDPRRVCLLNDSLVPFSIMSAISKRLFKRWVWLPPRVRTIVLAPILSVARRVLRGAERAVPGGLVFFALAADA